MHHANVSHENNLRLPPSDLWRGQSSGARWALRQHLLPAFTAAEAGRRRVFHGPVVGAEEVLDALWDLGSFPVLVTHRTRSLSEPQRSKTCGIASSVVR